MSRTRTRYVCGYWYGPVRLGTPRYGKIRTRYFYWFFGTARPNPRSSDRADRVHRVHRRRALHLLFTPASAASLLYDAVSSLLFLLAITALFAKAIETRATTHLHSILLPPFSEYKSSPTGVPSPDPPSLISFLHRRLEVRIPNNCLIAHTSYCTGSATGENGLVLALVIVSSISIITVLFSVKL
ncbi:hypothetical protein KSP39_PZI018548 [Platanthera zijinensis]|uniref:Uncharacterized protein n=1 Tax=Platanthera zijinensis TaxID=2320716 RepID=A0AAP0FZ81_9ASPA